MTEQEKQDSINSIDIDSITESVTTACLGCLDAIKQFTLIIEKNIKEGNLTAETKRLIIEKILEQAEND